MNPGASTPSIQTFQSFKSDQGSCFPNETSTGIARQATLTTVTGIVDRANSLNPAFLAPYDVQALYLP